MQFRKNQDYAGAPAGVRPNKQDRKRHWGRMFVCATVLAALAGVVGPSQNPGMPRSSVMPPNPASNMPDANQQMQMREKQDKQKNFEAANAERKKQIAEDSAKLLKLATDLKAEVDKTTKDTLSMQVIRKAAEIERLAHDVKGNIRPTAKAK